MHVLESRSRDDLIETAANYLEIEEIIVSMAIHIKIDLRRVFRDAICRQLATTYRGWLLLMILLLLLLILSCNEEIKHLSVGLQIFNGCGRWGSEKAPTNEVRGLF